MFTNAVDLGTELEKFAEMLETEVGMPDSPGIGPALPKGDVAPGISAALVAVMMIAVAALKRRRRG